MLVEDPEGIKQIMKDCKTIAIVGFSDDPGESRLFRRRLSEERRLQDHSRQSQSEMGPEGKVLFLIAGYPEG